MHHLATKNRNNLTWSHYKSFRNHVTTKIRLAKKEYYTNEIKLNRQNPSDMWKILKNLLPSKSTSTSDLDPNPDLFNDFFANIGTNLTRNFAPISLSSPFVVNPNDNPNNATFYLTEVNSNDVLHKILKLPNQNGLDQLEMNSLLLKLAAPLIAPSLTHIMNLSLCLGIFPSDWKCARVTPTCIYKGVGDKSEPYN